MAMSGWRRVLRGTTAATIAVVIYFVVPVEAGADGKVLQSGVVSVAALAAAGLFLLWQVGRQMAEPERSVDGLLLALILGVLAFALAFYRLAVEDPGQFGGLVTRVDALYFTLTTLLTVGYGDIHAEGQFARILVMLQMVFNVVVIATAASTLTSQIRTNMRRRAEARQRKSSRE